MFVFVLWATFLGTCIGKFHGFPTSYSVRTTRLVALLVTLDTHSRDDSLSIHYTKPYLVLDTSAHSLGYCNELHFLLEDLTLRLSSLQASIFKSLISLDCSLETQAELASRSLDPMIEGIDVVVVSSPSLMLSPNVIASLLHVSKDVMFSTVC